MLLETQQIYLNWLNRTQKSHKQFDISQYLFDKQLEFVNDPSQFVTAVTSRRAGKSTACVLHLLHTAITYPKSTSFYITYARTDAKGIVWPLLHELNRDLQLGGVANEADLIFKFPNDSVIRLGGAATSAEIDRFRGYAIKLVYIDEAQRFGNYIERLINDVLVPACFDYRGAIRLIGTPGPTPIGWYHDTFQNPEAWSTHRWTIFDNPWIFRKRGEMPQEILQKELNRRAVDESDPTIQREFFGNWSLDTRNLVLNYNKELNHFEQLPDGHTYSHIMGIDLGFKDADAICLLAHSDSSATTYLVHEDIRAKQGLTELFNQVETLRKEFNPYKIVIDTGGLGLKIAEEMRRRWRIPVHAAEKTRKFENLEILNDALRTRRFLARYDSRFAHDSMLLEWDNDKIRPDKKVISDRFHSDSVDATLYAFRESPAYSYEPPSQKPKYGSIEWGKEEEKKMEEAAEEFFKNKEITNELEWI